MSGSARTIAQRGTGLARRFFAWWFAELGALIGDRFGTTAPWRSRRIRIDCDGVTARVFDEFRGDARPIGQFRIGDMDGARAVFASPIGRKARAEHLPILVRLAGTRPIEKRLVLPLAAEENLREATAFELDRAFPLRPEDIVFGYEVAGRDSAKRQITLRVVVARRDVVEPALDRLAAHGVTPARVELIGENAPVAACDILPGDSARTSRPHRSGAVIALWGLTVCLAIIAVGLPIHRLRLQTETLSVQAATARAAAADVRRLRARIAASDETARFLIDRRLATPRISQVLNDVARILPDDTWLRELRVTGTEVILSGSSRSSAALIGLLDRGGAFHGTEFRSPTMRDSRTGRETFQIATTIREAGK